MSDEAETKGEVRGHLIAVGTHFHVVWDVDHLQTQRSFLEKTDPDYFQYCSDTHAAQLETGNRERAQIALRFNYSHAIECLFSLIGAAVQAPFCPAGWITIVSTRTLYSLVKAMSQREGMPNALNLEYLQWPAVVRSLNPVAPVDDMFTEHNDAVERLWRYLASQFLDDDFREEYNSIKHGLRVRSSPWFLDMGVEPSPGVPSQHIIRWAESNSGSNFLRKAALKKDQWQLRDGKSNWDPMNSVNLMPLIVRSIRNLRDLLLGQNGADASTITFTPLTVNEVNDALAFRASDRNGKFSVWMNIPKEGLQDVTQEDIKVDYESKLAAVWTND
jgi:hypothetical protein